MHSVLVVELRVTLNNIKVLNVPQKNFIERIKPT